MGSCTHEMTFNTKHAYLEALGDNDIWSALSGFRMFDLNPGGIKEN